MASFEGWGGGLHVVYWASGNTNSAQAIGWAETSKQPNTSQVIMKFFLPKRHLN